MVVGCQPLTGESMRWIKDTVSGLSTPHEAAARNRVTKMQKYVMQGGDINKQNKLGDTPLHEACAYIRDNGDTSKGKRRKIVGKDRRKVGKKLSIHSRGLGEGGPLDMLELLLNAGANINAQNIVGDAPLHKAALNGRALSADHLIREGADVNIRNEFAQTPLHAACVSGNIEVVQRLVQGGADISAQDAAEDTPFHEACRHQYEGIVIYLMGLVNKPTTSQGLELWEGLDPGWEKMLRSKAQARVDDAEERGEDPATAAPARSPAAIALSTPSTAHDSIQSGGSVGSTKGIGYARTPSALQFSNRASTSMTISVQSSHTESMSPPRVSLGHQHPTHQQEPIAEIESVPMTPPVCTTPVLPDGADMPRTRHRRGRNTNSREGKGKESVLPRTFSTAPAEVLAWQATKVKNEEQGRLIEQAREALREEQREAAMALSSTTMGDDDASVDTLNTPDHSSIGGRGVDASTNTPLPGDLHDDLSASAPRSTTPKISNGAPPRHGKERSAGSGRTVGRREADITLDSTDAAAAREVAMAWGTDTTGPGSVPGSRETTPVTNRHDGAGAGGEERQGRERVASLAESGSEKFRMPRSATPIPAMSTPPATGFRNIRLQSPARDGRRRAVRKGKGVALASPRPREPGSHRGSSRSQRTSSSNGGGSGGNRPPTGADSHPLAGTQHDGREPQSSSRRSRPSSNSSSHRNSGESTGGGGGEGGGGGNLDSSRHEGQPGPVRRGSNSSSLHSDGSKESRSVHHHRRHDHDHDRGASGSTNDGHHHRHQHHHRSEQRIPASASGESRSSSRRHGSHRSSGSSRTQGVDGEERRKPSSRSRDHEGSKRMHRSRSSRKKDGASGSSSGRGASAGGQQPGRGHEARGGSIRVREPSVTAAIEEGLKVPHAILTPRRKDSLSASIEEHQAQGKQKGEEVASVVVVPGAKDGGSKQAQKWQQEQQQQQKQQNLVQEGGDAAGKVAEVASSSALPEPKTAVGSGGISAAVAAAVAVAAVSKRAASPGARTATTIDGSGHTVQPVPKRRGGRAKLRSRWASDEVSADLIDAVPESKKRVVESNLPMKRMSPYRVRPQADGLPATLDGGSASHAKPVKSASVGASSSLCPNGQETPIPKGQAPVPYKRRGEVLPSGAPAPSHVHRSKSLSSGVAGKIVPVPAANGTAHGTTNDTPKVGTSNGTVNGISCRTVNGTPEVGIANDSSNGTVNGTPEVAPANGIFSGTISDTLKFNTKPKGDEKIANPTSATADGRRTPQPQTSLVPQDDAVSVCSTEDDIPPGIDALDTRTKTAAIINPAEGVVTLGDGAMGQPEAVYPTEEESKPLTWMDAAKETSSKAVAMTLRASKALLFSESDTEEEHTVGDDSTSAAENSRGSVTFGDSSFAKLPLAPPGPLDGETSGETTDADAWDKDVEATLEAAADGAACSVVRKRSTRETRRPAGTEAVAVALDGPAPAEEPPLAKKEELPVVVRVEGLAVEKDVSTTPTPIKGRRTSEIIDVKATDESARRAEVDVDAEVEQTSAERVSPPVDLSPPKSASTAPAASSFATGGLQASRARSSLGLPRNAPAKVAMPIAGGRAAWNKFLSSAADPSTPKSDAAGCSAVMGGNEGAALVCATPPRSDYGTTSEESDNRDTRICASSEAGSEASSTAAIKGPPRGFKEPVGTDGPNKGPAGAFSGNAMWRLAGGSSGRASTGVAANGHGGYSNPLAAMRTNAVTSTASSDALGSAGGGGVVANPLAGLRGAAAMGAAGGMTNPLARGGARGSLGGGMANPLLRHAGSRASYNPLARGGARGIGAGVGINAVAAVGRYSTEHSPSEQGGDDARSRPISAPAGGWSSVTLGMAQQKSSHGSDGCEETNDSSSINRTASADTGDVGEEEPTARVIEGSGGMGVVRLSSLPPPPSRRARASQVETQSEADKDPGQAKVASVVMALQNTANDARQGLVIQDPQHVEVSNVAEQGLVQLRRVQYSPRPA